MLVKDFCESDYAGRDFPWQRSFDWWHGHSWAKGLWEAADGKDQESSSEDGFASFAVKMWGRIAGDAAMEKRGEFVITLFFSFMAWEWEVKLEWMTLTQHIQGI
jgi:endo-1,3(4)-beta-glucanase